MARPIEETLVCDISICFLAQPRQKGREREREREEQNLGWGTDGLVGGFGWPVSLVGLSPVMAGRVENRINGRDAFFG